MSLIADPADLDASLIRAAELLQHLIENGTDITDDVNTDVVAITTNAVWPGSESFRSRSISVRLGYSALIRSKIRQLFDPIFLAYLRVAKKDARSITLSSFRDLYDYFISTSRVLMRRNPTFDSSVATTGTGNPTYRRLTLDRDGHVIESLWPESTKIKAKSVQPATAAGQETLEFRTESQIDLFSLAIAAESNGDGIKRTLTLLNSDNGFLRDASFEFNGAAIAAGNLSSLGSWKDEDGTSTANIAIVDDGYRPSVREKQRSDQSSSSPTKQCIRLASADIDISQKLTSLSEYSAYDAGIWVRDVAGSSTGNITLTIGGATPVTVTVASLVTNTWTLIALPLTAQNWAKTIKGNDPKFRITIDTLVGGLDIDAAFMVRMFKHNGSYWNVLPGTTPLGEDYTAQFDDTIATDSVVQKLLSFGYPNQNFWLPSAATASPSSLLETGI